MIDEKTCIDQGDRLFSEGELEAAADTYARAIQQNPNKAVYHCKFAKALLRQGEIEAAERCFQQALSLNPKSHLGLYGIAQVAAARKLWETAIDHYQRLLELTPGFAAAIYEDLEIAYDELEKEAELKRALEAERLSQWPFSCSLHGPPATLPNGKQWPKISVVTPSYNQGDFIEETILSVVGQNYPDVEYIVIDGGSTDETLSILEKYTREFSYVISEPDDGQSSAINKGFARATGEVFTWLNSDDRLAPGALYAIALAFYTSRADVVAGVCELLKDGKVSHTHLAACQSGRLKLEEILDAEGCWLTGRFFYQPEVMFTRELWERAGGQVDETLYYSMDYELWARFAHAEATIEVIGHPVAQYRMHEAQKTSTTEMYRPELLETCERLRQKFDCAPLLAATDIESVEPVMRSLRIAFFNDVGTNGGAGIAHHRIAQAFQSAGHQVDSIAATMDWSLAPSSVQPGEVVSKLSELDPDFVVVGNVHNTQHSVEILQAISARFPTLFVMHDQWLLTGRCAYTGSCSKYAQMCNEACPTWDAYPVLAPDKISETFQDKRYLIGNPKLFIATDSRWLKSWVRDAIAASPIASEKVASSLQSIHYGLDTNIFKPRNSLEMRRRLGLPKDKFIIITGSQSLEDDRKGSKVLLEALRLINRKDILLVCFGHSAAATDEVDTYFTGFIEDPAVLAWYYGAADLFVGPSLEEAFGQTFIEAAACGTPAVGFEVGGVSQAIAHNISGKLARQVSAQALADVILELIEDPAELTRIKRSAPIHIRSLYSLQRSYYTFVRALESSGLLKRLNVRLTAKFRRICDVPKPLPIEPGASAALTRPLIQGPELQGLLMSGFGHAEFPRSDLDLSGGSRWLLWPVGRFSIESGDEQLGQLTVFFRNFVEDQVITLQKDGEQVLIVSATTTHLKQASAISVPMILQPGYNFFDVSISSFHSSTKNAQALGILVEKILFSQLPPLLTDGNVSKKL